MVPSIWVRRPHFRPPFPIAMIPASGNLNSFSIDIFNANGLLLQATEFSSFVYNKDLAIDLEGETFFYQVNVTKIANYELLYVDRAFSSNRTYGGIVIYVKRELSASSNKFPILNLVLIPIILDFPYIPKLLIAANYSLLAEIGTDWSKILPGSLIIFLILFLRVILTLFIHLEIADQRIVLVLNSEDGWIKGFRKL